MWRLIQGDCLEILPTLDDNSIDCVITDPPYFIHGLGNSWNHEKIKEEKRRDVAIPLLPIGMKFDPQQGKKLYDFTLKYAEEIYRILKPGGFFLVCNQPRLLHRSACAIEDVGFEIRDVIVWERATKGKAFSQDHFVKRMKISEEEKIEILNSLGGRKTPQLRGCHEDIILAQKPKDGTFVENWMKWGVGLVDFSHKIDDLMAANVMNVPKPNNEERKEASDHLTLKPILLMEHLVRLFTKEGDTILDCFMGSGTTGVACKKFNRNFIGIELDENYYKIAEERINNV